MISINQKGLKNIMKKYSKYLLSLFMLLLFSKAALAVPSFARQTGQDCAACHIGGFGPQLTPYGIKFKMGGYTDSDGKGGHIPLSAMLVESFTHTKKDLSENAAPHFGTNDNTSLQEVSAFVAGRVNDNAGGFAQVTWGEPDRKTAMDNFDLRLVKAMEISDRDTVLGVSLNNNPTAQDAFNTIPAWRFPYMSSELAPTPAASPLIDGALAQQVLGMSAYGFYDNHWYGELGGYKSFSGTMLDKMNVEPGDKISGVSPYWRFAYFKDAHKRAYSVGVFGMNSKLMPGGAQGPTNRYNDIGVDGTYQFLGTRKHIVTFNGSYIHENSNLTGSYLAGDASKRSGSLNRTDLNGSYYYAKSYGITLDLFDVHGNSDAMLYAAAADSGSRTNSPNSRGYTLQVDWTPLGKEDSWGAPFANMRVGLQYTGYSKFNGAKNNYDGSGRNASDNNTVYSFVWFAL